MHEANNRIVIVITVIVALWLSIVPLPLWAQWGRPELVAMVVFYWVMALPERVGIGFAWLVGLTQDIVEGSILGQHALSLSILAYLVLVLYQRLRMFTPLQQATVVLLFICLNQMLGHWVQSILGVAAVDLIFLMPAIVSGLLWPLVVVFLRLLRRSYHVS